jgi:hypothetical protein
MQPYVFSPWAWRDPAWFTDQMPPADETEATEAAQRGRSNLEGYHVEAADGSIGSVDEASHEVDSAHLVVDTGPWIFGRKVLLPAGTVQRVDHAEGKVYVDLTKEQIKNSPEYDPDTFGKPDYRAQVGSYYEETYRG